MVRVGSRHAEAATRLRGWLNWRPAGPIGWACFAGAVLVLLGIAFAVVVPLTAGSASGDNAPATAASPGPKAPAVSTSSDPAAADASPLPNVPATAKTSTLESQLIQLLNKVHEQGRCDRLDTNGRLRNSARAHSADMAKNGFVGRKGSDDSSPQDRMRKAGYKHPKGEDVGSGYTSAQAALDAWQGDPGQRGILSDCDVKAVGVGVVAAKDGTLYWTADFGA
jgi:uncharacterized protein YkwD